MKNKLIIYTTSWCGDCFQLKKFLNENNILYDEKNIEENEEDFKTMLSYTNGKRIIPTVNINGTILINPKPTELKNLLNQ